VLTALTPSKAWCEHHKQRYRPVTKWAELLLLTLHRWLPERVIVAVMDGEFAAIDLLHRLRRSMVVITRLRLDACLFDPPSAYKGRGRYPKKGKRQLSLRARITDRATVWKRAVQASRTSWRSGGWIEYASATALWYHGGKPPLPIRWAEQPKVPRAARVEWLRRGWFVTRTSGMTRRPFSAPTRKWPHLTCSTATIAAGR
jgi:hypothetical protein